MHTKKAVHNYLSVFDASEYKIQLIHADKEHFKPISVLFTSHQLIKSIGFLQHKNTLGYNIYCRPIGYQYILLDDLKRDVLEDLSLIKPCLLMETSPKNYQAFITLNHIPENREIALQACRQLARIYSADTGSAEPDHVGRLPGFTNRKPKYCDCQGKYPFVRLHKFEKRESTFIPQWGPCAQKLNSSISKRSHESDRSRKDFNIACMLIRQQKSDEQIRAVLEQESEKAKERKDDYIGRTIINARKTVN